MGGRGFTTFKGLNTPPVTALARGRLATEAISTELIGAATGFSQNGFLKKRPSTGSVIRPYYHGHAYERGQGAALMALARLEE